MRFNKRGDSRGDPEGRPGGFDCSGNLDDFGELDFGDDWNFDQILDLDNLAGLDDPGDLGGGWSGATVRPPDEAPAAEGGGPAAERLEGGALEVYRPNRELEDYYAGLASPDLDLDDSENLDGSDSAPRTAGSPAPDPLDPAQVERLHYRLAGASIIFGLIRLGRESLFRELELASFRDLAALRRAAEGFERTLSTALARLMDALWPPVALASRNPADLGPRLIEALAVLEVYRPMVLGRASEFDKAARGLRVRIGRNDAAGWPARLAGLAEGLALLEHLRLRDLCQRAGALAELVLEGLKGYLAGGGALSDLSPGGASLRLTLPLLRRIRIDPRDHSARLWAAREVVAELKASLSFALDRRIPGRLRVLRVLSFSAGLDPERLRRPLTALQAHLQECATRTLVHCGGRHLEALREIQRAIDLGPARFGSGLSRLAAGLRDAWRLLASFSRPGLSDAGAAPAPPVIAKRGGRG